MGVWWCFTVGDLNCLAANTYAGKRRYNIRLWKTFTDCFNCLPVAAILDEKIFCCHGGESPLSVCLPAGIHAMCLCLFCVCRPLPRYAVHGTDSENHAANGRSRPRFIVNWLFNEILLLGCKVDSASWLGS